jgi:hypothetical protein
MTALLDVYRNITTSQTVCHEVEAQQGHKDKANAADM